MLKLSPKISLDIPINVMLIQKKHVVRKVMRSIMLPNCVLPGFGPGHHTDDLYCR